MVVEARKCRFLRHQCDELGINTATSRVPCNSHPLSTHRYQQKVASCFVLQEKTAAIAVAVAGGALKLNEMQGVAVSAAAIPLLL